jgi:exopolyphosphatase/guanosine-5'-triphosphate,3'-diphosphate pyrophosphatase
MPCVAVIDIGSNSIKILVAESKADGRPVALKARTIEARISAGISSKRPSLGLEGMARGAAAVADLVAQAATFVPSQIVIVATSAVRDAANGAEFCARIQAETGHPVRILSGDEEANLIGQGLLCDPTLPELKDFFVFDLGGGSLECLHFHDRKIAQAVSLPLGCVRLTEKFVPDPAAPYSSDEPIAGHVRHVIAESGFCAAPGAEAIGTGGTLTTVRAILAARAGRTFDAFDPRIEVATLKSLLAQIGALTRTERSTVEGLTPGRADIFPAALSTLIEIAHICGFDAYHHSIYNLRWGVASEELARLSHE